MPRNATLDIAALLKGKPDGYTVKAFPFAVAGEKDKPEAITGFKVLDAAQGIGECIVSVFGNEDYGGDVVVRGFFANSIANKADLPSGVWCHDWTQPVALTLDAEELAPGDPRLPAKIASNGGLYIKAQYNLDTQRGREAFSDVSKGLIRQYSFGYMVDDYKYDPQTGACLLLNGQMFEWSPVLVGMNPLTATLSAKGRFEVKAALPVHHTPVQDGAWDGPAQEKNLPNDGDAGDYKKAFAWMDPEADPDTKSAYKFIHHFVGDGGKVGAASKIACSAGIAVLNGGRGGTTIPDADRKGVWEHLAAHLKDDGVADEDIPALKSLSGTGLKLAELAQAVVDAASGTLDRGKALADGAHELTERAKSRHELRRKDGRVLSSATLMVLGDLSGDLDDVISILSDARDDLNTFMAAVTGNGSGDGGDGEDDDEAGKALATEAMRLKARLLALRTNDLSNTKEEPQ